METESRKTMNGKPVFEVPGKQIINFESGFRHKLLCDGPTFTTGSACAYSCAFCYVPDLMRKNPHMKGIEQPHPEIVIRRTNSIRAMRDQLTDRHGPRFLREPDETTKPENRHLYGPAVVYASPLVDVAANMDLVNETIEACKTILTLTRWHIRLLSKSNLLPKVAQGLEGFCGSEDARKRIIYGVSTGTLNDKLAQAFEEGTPLVSKRISSLHWLQDNGYRTYGMICPSLPFEDGWEFCQFSRAMSDAIRADKCEHVWGEVINARGESFTRTHNALLQAGFTREAQAFHNVSIHAETWEQYARDTFRAHAAVYDGQTGPDGKPKLRFLQYVTKPTRDWWKERENIGAILL